MTCQELIELLASYLEGSVTADQERVISEHLDECPDCVKYLDSYRKTVSLEKAAYSHREDRVVKVPQKVVAAILAALTLRNMSSPPSVDSSDRSTNTSSTDE